MIGLLAFVVLRQGALADEQKVEQVFADMNPIDFQQKETG
jgi:hypothetical protein